MKCIVMNSSVVIALSKLELLHLLAKLYDKVVIPAYVYREVVVEGSGKPGSRELQELLDSADNVMLQEAEDRKLVESLHDPLGWGEAEAIAIALESNCYVGLDDRIARNKARSLNLEIIGTLGILRRAYDHNLISKDQFINSIKRLKEFGFRISDDIIKELIEKLNDKC